MGDIVAFRPRPRSASLTNAEDPERGRIVLFTGVRYEREEPPTAAPIEATPPPAPAGGARKRRRG